MAKLQKTHLGWALFNAVCRCIGITPNYWQLCECFLMDYIVFFKNQYSSIVWNQYQPISPDTNVCGCPTSILRRINDKYSSLTNYKHVILFFKICPHKVLFMTSALDIIGNVDLCSLCLSLGSLASSLSPNTRHPRVVWRSGWKRSFVSLLGSAINWWHVRGVTSGCHGHFSACQQGKWRSQNRTDGWKNKWMEIK